MQSDKLSLSKGTCVVSFDVVSSIQSFRSKGLVVPNQNDPMFEQLRQSLLERVTRAFVNLTIHLVDKNELRFEIWKHVQKRVTEVNRHAVLVTCSEMADLNPHNEGLNLSINRLFDSDGKMLGYGPRPGFDYLNNQFDKLAHKIAGRPVILAKEGAFRGNTCQYILKELESRNVKVATVIIGFSDTGSKAAIAQVFQGELVIVNEFDHLVEWIADRDLIPFVPGCGRVVGEFVTHSFAPVQTVEGFSCAFPYIMPFGMMEKWTSLPADNARELSVFFLEMSIKLFSQIGRDTGHNIQVGEVLGNHPRVSMAVKVGVGVDLLVPNMGVVDFLKQMRGEIK